MISVEEQGERVWARLLLRLARENPELAAYAQTLDYLALADFVEGALTTARAVTKGPNETKKPESPPRDRIARDLHRALYEEIKILHTQGKKVKQGVWAPVQLRLPGEAPIEGEGAWFQFPDSTGKPVGKPQFRYTEQKSPHVTILRILEWNNLSQRFMLVQSVNP